MSHYKLADTLEISQEEAKKIIDKFFNAVPKVKQFLNSVAHLAKTRGYIRTAQPYGRIRWFVGYEDKEDFRRQSEIERAGKNSPIQGTNGDVIKQVLVNLQDKINKENLPIFILLSIYDEIVLECKEYFAEECKTLLEKEMIKAAEIVIKSIPVVVDVKISDYWDK
jgi:DNA polymerase-1